jgi:cytochrome c553
MCRPAAPRSSTRSSASTAARIAVEARQAMRAGDRHHAVVLAIAAIAGVTSACAVHAADVQTRALAASCRSCHHAAEKVIPSLDGQPRDALVATLRAIRDATQAGTVMPQHAKGYTEAELEAIAAFFAQRGNPP